jgi:hypothetical protein
VRTAVENKNSIHQENNIGLNWGNACYRAVQNPLCSRLLSKILKTEAYKIYRTVILPLVLCGFETWSLAAREHRIDSV